MPDHIQAEALRYAVIIQVMPTTAISPEGKMSCLDPSAAQLYRMTPIRSPHVPIISRR